MKYCSPSLENPTKGQRSPKPPPFSLHLSLLRAREDVKIFCPTKDDSTFFTGFKEQIFAPIGLQRKSREMGKSLGKGAALQAEPGC